MSPGQIDDMSKTVEAVDAYKRAENGGALNDAADNHVGDYVCPENIFLGFTLRLGYFTMACNDFMFCVVNLKRGNGKLFAHVFLRSRTNLSST